VAGKIVKTKEEIFSPAKLLQKSWIFGCLLLVLTIFLISNDYYQFFPLEINRRVFTNAAKESTHSFHFAFPTRCTKVFVVFENPHKPMS